MSVNTKWREKVFRITDENKQYRCTSRGVAGQGRPGERETIIWETISGLGNSRKFNKGTYALRMSTFRSWSSKLWLVFVCFYVSLFFSFFRLTSFTVHYTWTIITFAVVHSSNSLSYATLIERFRLKSAVAYENKDEQTVNKKK